MNNKKNKNSNLFAQITYWIRIIFPERDIIRN